jgi:5-methylthioadenosine/S-adenosylhomocysteine deaminase
MEDVARATIEAGLRGILSYGIIDPVDEDGMKRQKNDTLEFLNHVKSLKNPRIGFAVGPHAAYTCREETLQWSSELAEKEDALVNIHVAETRHEQAQFENEKKHRVVEYLDNIGFLSERVLAAHSVWLTKSEVKIYGKNHVNVAHCPVSNMKLAGGGAAPIPEMWNANVAVGLGTDGAASNNGLDMFDTMKVGALLQKTMRWDPTIANAQKMLDMATIDGARAIRKEKMIGSIEPGKQADLVLLDLKDPNMMPLHGEHTVVSDIVYSANGFNVDSTFVDGVPLMLNKKILTLDSGKVSSAVSDSVSSLLV